MTYCNLCNETDATEKRLVCPNIEMNYYPLGKYVIPSLTVIITDVLAYRGFNVSHQLFVVDSFFF